MAQSRPPNTPSCAGSSNVASFPPCPERRSGPSCPTQRHTNMSKALRGRHGFVLSAPPIASVPAHPPAPSHKARRRGLHRCSCTQPCGSGALAPVPGLGPTKQGGPPNGWSSCHGLGEIGMKQGLEMGIQTGWTSCR